ncbi:MAG: translocation/assembly module TamB, partial [Bacteroidales bacterium]|nr:translocation/assembly module TamB [Bacteroidales bacterium]
DSIFSINGQSPRIEYKNFAGENWSFSNDAQKTNVTLNTGFQRLVLIPPDADDTMGMVRHDFLLTLEMYHGIVDYDVMWDNFSNDTLHYFLKGFCDLTKYPETNFKITDMQAPFQQSLWDIADDNYIKIDTNKNIEIHNIHFYSDSSYLKMNGFFAQDSLSKTEVQMDISNLDLSMVNFLLDDYETEIKGVVSGSADFEKENNSLSFISDVEIDQLWINDNKMGDMILLSQWDPEKNAISLKVESSITNVYGKVTYPLQIEGYIKPDDENDFFDLSMNLNNIRLAILDPFIHDFVEQTSGFLTGNAVLKGSLKEPKLKASIEMNRCEALIKYTNVLYFFDGSIDVDEQLISFHNLVVSDSMQGTAMIEGGIKHRTFSDFNLDLKLKTSEFKILNTNRIQNDIFYGKAIVSGDINVFGPINDINISAFVRTNQGTDMSIPISSAMSVDENTYVIFKLPPSDSLKANKMKSSIMGLTLSLRMMMTPEGQVRIYLPGDVGNLVANGNGLITLGLNKRGDFSLSGTYILDGGRFLLNLENIISKKFEINKGSSITFNGDPMDAMLNVSATYGTRTTLMGLGIALDSTLLKQRTNVDCILRMTDELSDPQISFSIDFPGQSEDFKQTVFSQLDTTNEVLMTQQAFSLLVVNSFSLNTTGTSLGSTMASSGVSMLTNQINGWLSQLSKDVNIGINYRPGDKLSSDEIGVALSTQLFNNRVTIDANVGYSGHSATSNRASSVVGDVSVEVKITKDGRFSTKVFSRSNANDISKIGTNSEQGYTYGVGLNYRKNFDKFSEIFSRTPEQKRQRALKKETKKASKKNDILET